MGRRGGGGAPGRGFLEEVARELGATAMAGCGGGFCRSGSGRSSLARASKTRDRGDEDLERFPTANQSFKQDANFAVAGATALKQHRGLPMQAGGVRLPPSNNISLSDELGWFDAMKPSLCSSPQACKEYFSKAMFVVRELGWNDYGVMSAAKASLRCNLTCPKSSEQSLHHREADQRRRHDDHRIGDIAAEVCAGDLVLLGSQDKADYEPDTGCLRTLNLLSKSHNSQLREAVARLGSRHPGARITYADLYAPLIGFAVALARYRFDGADGALRACCGGGGGRYNFNLSAACGMPGVSACARLSAYVNWDGVHLTEAAYRRVTDGWLRGPYANPPILSAA
uniref:GDSL esterase/lipase n=1 Tax=Setaria viridis TaxID=4556 RepID=A0A4V6D6I5_SETVI|nr:hypothetical protein SEVIR_5G148900v2 [Setaria viridis]